MVGAKRVAQWKIDEVEELKEMLKDSRSVGIATFRNLPSADFQKIRMDVGEKIRIKVSRNTLISRALSDLGISGLSDHMRNESAVIAYDGDAFELYSMLAEKRYPLPAKAGQVATSDIWVKKGDTNLRPGPVLSELQKAGVPAAIDKGKIVIRDDKLLVRANEVISADVALALQRLEILPFEASLHPNAIFESGVVFRSEDLKIDLNERISQIVSARNNALELAIAAGYMTSDTITVLMGRAQRNAIALAMNSGFVEDETVALLISQAQTRAAALSSLVSEGQPEVKGDREEKKEEKKEEASEEDIASGLGALFG